MYPIFHFFEIIYYEITCIYRLPQSVYTVLSLLNFQIKYNFSPNKV